MTCRLVNYVVPVLISLQSGSLVKFGCAQCFEHNVFCCFCIGVSLARILFIAIKSLMLSLCALRHATVKLPYNISECSFVCLQLCWCGAHISEREQCRRRPGNSPPLNSLSLSGLPSHQLRLKVNSPIILMRNLDPALLVLNGRNP